MNVYYKGNSVNKSSVFLFTDYIGHKILTFMFKDLLGSNTEFNSITFNLK